MSRKGGGFIALPPSLSAGSLFHYKVTLFSRIFFPRVQTSLT